MNGTAFLVALQLADKRLVDPKRLRSPKKPKIYGKRRVGRFEKVGGEIYQG